jgi:hypothetical protein
MFFTKYRELSKKRGKKVMSRKYPVFPFNKKTGLFHILKTLFFAVLCFYHFLFKDSSKKYYERRRRDSQSPQRYQPKNTNTAMERQNPVGSSSHPRQSLEYTSPAKQPAERHSRGYTRRHVPEPVCFIFIRSEIIYDFLASSIYYTIFADSTASSLK